MLWGIVIGGIVLLSLLLGAAGYAFGGMIFAIPIFVIIAGGALATIVGGRSVLRTRRHHHRIRRFRTQARAQKQDFSPKDRQTLV
jgi:dolichol kinase